MRNEKSLYNVLKNHITIKSLSSVFYVMMTSNYSKRNYKTDFKTRLIIPLIFMSDVLLVQQKCDILYHINLYS